MECVWKPETLSLIGPSAKQGTKHCTGAMLGGLGAAASAPGSSHRHGDGGKAQALLSCVLLAQRPGPPELLPAAKCLVWGDVGLGGRSCNTNQRRSHLSLASSSTPRSRSRFSYSLSSLRGGWKFPLYSQVPRRNQGDKPSPCLAVQGVRRQVCLSIPRIMKRPSGHPALHARQLTAPPGSLGRAHGAGQHGGCPGPRSKMGLSPPCPRGYPPPQPQGCSQGVQPLQGGQAPVIDFSGKQRYF